MDRVYAATTRQMSNRRFRDRIIQWALAEACAWRDRYQRYDELSEICEAITRAIQGPAKGK